MNFYRIETESPAIEFLIRRGTPRPNANKCGCIEACNEELHIIFAERTGAGLNEFFGEKTGSNFRKEDRDVSFMLLF